MNLLPDYTFFFQLLIFLVVLFSLNSLLFKPVLALLDKRKTATVGTHDEVGALKEKAEQKLKEYETKIAQARIVGGQLKDKIKKEGEVVALEKIGQSRKKADEYVSNMQSQITQQSLEARLSLGKEAENLAKQFAEELLGRAIR